MSFFAELQRRNVVRVGIAYAIIAWVLAQIAEFAFENFGAPDWVLKSVVVLLLLGLPIALFFAWAFEMTPEGVKLEKDVDRSASITPTTGRKLDRVIILALVVAVVYFALDRGADEPAATADGEVPVAAVEPDTAESATSKPAARSIAVLPFVNMSSDQEQEWFSDGLTEEILNALARTPDLLVAARTSSFKFKGTNEDVPTIADALGVEHVLEGSVRRGGDQLRITAQLIRASDGFHLWSETYDRKPEDVISVQEDIAIEIATALETAMDPEALAQMVSAGTSSVAAYNAYLRGLAHGISTATNSDPFELLAARDAFDEAIRLDPEFALAYWELAIFWNAQLSSTFIIAGQLDMTSDEMRAEFDTAIENAIKYEEDPVSQLEYRAMRAYEYMQFEQSLRLNSQFLEQRPNDQSAQLAQLALLANMSMDDELRTAIEDYQERDGYDVFVINTSMTDSLISDDKDFIRGFAQEGMRRLGDQAFVQYQAHRSLLWAGDIDGASQIKTMMDGGDIPATSLLLVGLRQACAENRLDDAARIYDELKNNHADDTSLMWIGNTLMNQLDAATEVLMELDSPEHLHILTDYLNYAYFDARQFPNLMKLLESQGITPREPREVPYRCKL